MVLFKVAIPLIFFICSKFNFLPPLSIHLLTISVKVASPSPIIQKSIF